MMRVMRVMEAMRVMRGLAIGLTLLAAALAAQPAPQATATERPPIRLAQVNAPNIPPPPVVTPPRTTPEPLANRPERTRPGDESAADESAADAAADAAATEPDIVVVRVPGDADPDVGARIARAHGLRLLAESRLALLDRRVLRFRIPDGRPVPEVVQALAGDAGLEAAQPSFVFELQGGSGRPAQYAAETLRLPAAHALARGSGITVALIDTGVDGTHPALRGARIRGLTVLDADRPRPADHGTQMAAIMVARGPLSGVAPEARLVAIEAFAGASRTAPAGPARSHSLAVAKALDMAALEGAQVVNLSFAGGADPLVAELIDALARRGVVLVAAAGNHGPGAPPAHPAAHPAVIAVTATDARDRLFDGANRGGYVGLAAPGVDVITAAAGGRYGIVSGTSAAAAHVSGAAALVLQRHPGIAAAALRRILSETAVDLGRPGPDPDFGAGRIDPVAALSRVPERLAQPAE